MPRLLIQNRSWSVIQIKTNDLQPGDLIFLKNPHHRRLITHLAIALTVNEIFHCSRRKNGCIETIDELFQRYTQPSVEELVTYQDPRSTSLSEQQLPIAVNS